MIFDEAVYALGLRHFGGEIEESKKDSLMAFAKAIVT
jgi:hypothetical protein